MSTRPVSIVGIGQIEVMKASPLSLRQMGAQAVQRALEDAGVTRVDALFAGNMLSDELQNQKHVAALIADEAGLHGIEALEVKAATATGAAAMRMAYFAVASGEADLAIAIGVEKMSEGAATPALAKALDAEQELPAGATLISRNADLMRLYMERYKMPENGLANFSVNAHLNARYNPNALYRDKRLSVREVMSRVSSMRRFGCWIVRRSAMGRRRLYWRRLRKPALIPTGQCISSRLALPRIDSALAIDAIHCG